MVRINANRQPVYERYRDDIQFQFDCVLIEGDGGEVQVEGNNAEQKLKAANFVKLIAHDPIRESDYDDVPLQAIYKPIFGQCFNGQLQRALEFKHAVLIDGLDNQNHNVRIISPNADDRLEVLQFLLQIEDFADHGNDYPDTKNVGDQLTRLLRQTGESVAQQSIIQTLTVRLKEVLLELIGEAKMNYRRKSSVSQSLMTASSSNSEVILIEEENEDDFAKEQRALLDQKGQMLYMRVREQYPQWDAVEVQTYIIEEIHRAHQEKRDIVTKDLLKGLVERFTVDDELIRVVDDHGADKYDIGEDIVHEWFLSNYEESPAPNMCIYKKDLFKQYITLFELHYSGDNYETQYEIFIDQIHNCLQVNSDKFARVKTQGNSGKNAKKRFVYLRRRGAIAELNIPAQIALNAHDDDHGWTDLATAVNKRVAPVILATAVTKNTMPSRNSQLNTELTIRSPWEDRNRAYYESREFGVEGDPLCRRIVIDGSNVARDHGKVAEVKRRNNNHEIFSVVGIKIAVEHFWRLGCRKITVFLPPSRRSNKGLPRIPERELKLQRKMEDLDIIKYTAGRKIQNRFVQSYDDRDILDLAVVENGIVVSNDQFRDLINDKPSYAEVIHERLLPYIYTEDNIIPSSEPPRLGQLLPLRKFIRH